MIFIRLEDATPEYVEAQHKDALIRYNVRPGQEHWFRNRYNRSNALEILVEEKIGSWPNRVLTNYQHFGGAVILRYDSDLDAEYVVKMAEVVIECNGKKFLFDHLEAVHEVEEAYGNETHYMYLDFQFREPK